MQGAVPVEARFLVRFKAQLRTVPSHSETYGEGGPETATQKRTKILLLLVDAEAVIFENSLLPKPMLNLMLRFLWSLARMHEVIYCALFDVS